jgi:hypothetical protein
MSEFSGPEALSWLKTNKNPNPFATNRFQTAAEALEAVKRLYAAGAIEVHVGPALDDSERIEEEGGPYADGLIVVFPMENVNQIMSVVESLKPDLGGEMKDIIKDEGRYWRVVLWWD